ncbi:hypothetical protein ACIGW8_05350 [Streptomyces sioyaensis]|uniref:hypothetical protein n=1 Tax=Streptomyces sioyaensis TaxID=67364 RepID=UPI0037CD4C43
MALGTRAVCTEPSRALHKTVHTAQAITRRHAPPICACGEAAGEPLIRPWREADRPASRGLALKFAKGQDRLDSLSSTLNTALQNAAGMAGNDDDGHKFGKKYDPAANALFRTLSGAVRAIGQPGFQSDHHFPPLGT